VAYCFVSGGRQGYHLREKAASYKPLLRAEKDGIGLKTPFSGTPTLDNRQVIGEKRDFLLRSLNTSCLRV
jgi:hypothetical protein